VEAKHLMQTSAKFCEVFTLTFASFVHKIAPLHLSVVQVILSFAAPPNLHYVLLICEQNR